MAKLNRNNGIIKIDLENIILKDNVRKTYEEIEERARSIESIGQLQPVIVQASKEQEGKYELIAGYCRFKGFELLVSEGKPYNQIEAIVKNGDPYIIQLTENIQRLNLKSVEVEAGIKQLYDSGNKAVEISELIKKSKTWVSDILAAEKVRSMIDIDTSVMTSSAIKHLRKLDKKTLNNIIGPILEAGGTVAAVKAALEALNAPAGSQAAAEGPEEKKPVKESKGQNKAAEGTPAAKDPYIVLYSHIDKMVNSGIEKAEILDKINEYIGK